ncbi:MAG TPA: family 1 glycosylhydrolase [Mycobacteriales bacterium]
MAAGARTDPADVAAVAEAITLATAEAAVRLRGTGQPVASIFGLSTEVGLDDLPETATVLRRVRANNWDAWLGLARDGVLQIPGRDPVERPDLVRPFDLVGFSYYATVGVAQGRVVPYPAGEPVSAMGYVPWAEGLGLVLRRLHEELPGQPLLVAEYGIGTDDDALRAAYLRKGLDVTLAAVAAGVDVRGFFHWTAVDNYEWLHGYDVAFGLIDRDRAVRPSAQVLADEALRAASSG